MAEGELVFAGEPILTVTAPLHRRPAARDAAHQHRRPGDDDRLQGGPRARWPAPGGPSSTSRPGATTASRRRCAVARASVRRRGRGHVAGGGGPALRLAAVGHDGPLVRDGPRRRGRDAFRGLPPPVRAGVDPARRHLRHGRGRARRRWRRCRPKGVVARGVRIDSGDLGALAARGAGHPRRRRVRARCRSSRRAISTRTASPRLVAAGAPIDAFGVGTQLGTSADAPYLGMVYKLVEQGGQPRLEAVAGQAHAARAASRSGGPTGVDVIALDGEPGPPAPARCWRRCSTVARPAAVGSLAAARDRCTAALASWTGRAPAVRAMRRPWPPWPEGLSRRRPGYDRPVPERIGVFGGTFDPPHVGHLVTAVNVRHAARPRPRAARRRQRAVAEGGPARHQRRRGSLRAGRGGGARRCTGLEASRIELDRGGPELHGRHAGRAGRAPSRRRSCSRSSARTPPPGWRPGSAIARWRPAPRSSWSSDRAGGPCCPTASTGCGSRCRTSRCRAPTCGRGSSTGGRSTTCCPPAVIDGIRQRRLYGVPV